MGHEPSIEWGCCISEHCSQSQRSVREWSTGALDFSISLNSYSSWPDYLQVARELLESAHAAVHSCPEGDHAC